MKITREETSPREVTLNIELDAADVEPYLDMAYKRVVNRVQIPGFRRGKAPRYIVENFVGREALVRENLDHIVHESLERAIKEENLETFGEPEVEVVEIDPLSVKSVVPLEPIVELGDFRSLWLKREPVEVTEEEVDRAIEQVRYNGAPWEPVDRPVRFGDLVTLDLEGIIEGRKVADDTGVEFIPTLENTLPFPGFSVYLEGMQRDEPKEFALKVPDNYPDKTIQGKECRFHVNVREIKEKVLPEVDDEFAKGVGDGYENLEALRASIMNDRTERAQIEAERAFQERSLEEVVKGASVEVSDLTTNKEIDHLLEDRLQGPRGHQMEMDTYLENVGKSEEELRDEMRPTAQERLTRYLVVRKLAQGEGIQVSPEEIDDEVEKLASVSGESEEALRKAFSSDRARSSIGGAILTRKVLESLGQIVGGLAVEGETSSEGSEVSTGGVEVFGEEQGAEEMALSSTENAGDGQPDEEGGKPSEV